MKIETWEDAVTKHSELKKIAKFLSLTEKQARTLQVLSRLEKPGLYASINEDRKKNILTVVIHCISSRVVGRVTLSNENIDWKELLSSFQAVHLKSLSDVTYKLEGLNDIIGSLNR
jgi:hypothetical protein